MGIRKGHNGADFFLAGGLAETYDGAGGFDIVSYMSAGAASIDLENAGSNSGAAKGDDFNSIESFRLSRGADRFLGDTRTNYVNGDAGHDRLDGRAGNDALSGHSGDDTLLGGEGNDGMWGGSGADLFQGEEGKDLINGDSGHDTLRGDSGNDTVNGGTGNDTMTGGTDNGSFTIATDSSTLMFELSPGIRVAYDDIDTKGEFATTHKWAPHSQAIAHSLIKNNVYTQIATLPDGDRMLVITNKNNFDLNFDVGTSMTQTAPGLLGLLLQQTKESFVYGNTSQVLAAGKSVLVNIGTIDDTGLTVDDGWTFKSYQPVVKFSQLLQGVAAVSVSASSNAAQMIPDTVVKSFTAGDRLTGGAGSDTFRFAIGDGVDLITDFQKGADRIDVDNIWFDGNRANGEYRVFDHAGGAVILFSDTSRDGYVDNAAIKLAGYSAAQIDASVFV